MAALFFVDGKTVSRSFHREMHSGAAGRAHRKA